MEENRATYFNFHEGKLSGERRPQNRSSIRDSCLDISVTQVTQTGSGHIQESHPMGTRNIIIEGGKTTSD